MSLKEVLPWRAVLALFLLKGVWSLLRGTTRLTYRLAWRWRRFLAPLWVGAGAALLGELGHRYWPGQWWAALVLVPVAVAVAVPDNPVRSRYRALLERLVPDHEAPVLRPIERAYAGAVLLALAGWLALRTGAGASDLTAALWQGATGALGAAWWWHRRVRSTGRAERYRRKIEKLSRSHTPVPDLKVYAGAKVIRTQAARGSTRLRIRLATGLTAETAAPSARAMASHLGLRPGSVHVQEDPTRARCIWLQVIPADPWRGTIPHPCPDVLATTLSAMGGQWQMGVRADGSPDLYRLQHTWLVGRTGSGKSKWIESLLRWLLAFQDVVLVGIDMAHGATLAPWRKVFALPLAEDLDSAMWTLERVLAVIADRERRLGLDKEAGGNTDSFEPTPRDPWLVLVIDEFSDLVNQGGRAAVALLNRISKRARKAGVVFIFCSQNASKTDAGIKEIQSQATCTIGLSLSAHANRVMWGDLIKLGWSCVRLLVGQYLQRDDDHPSPEPSKGFLVRGSDRRAAVAAAEGRLPVLESSAWAELTGTGPGVAVPPPSPADPFLSALAELGPSRAEALAAAAGTSRATAFRRLRKLAADGRVTSEAGVWRARSQAGAGRAGAREGE